MIFSVFFCLLPLLSTAELSSTEAKTRKGSAEQVEVMVPDFGVVVAVGCQVQLFTP